MQQVQSTVRAPGLTLPLDTQVSHVRRPQTTLAWTPFPFAEKHPALFSCFLMAFTCHHTKPPREAQCWGFFFSPAFVFLDLMKFTTLSLPIILQPKLRERERKEYWQLPLIRFMLSPLKLSLFLYYYSSCQVTCLNVVTQQLVTRAVPQIICHQDNLILSGVASALRNGEPGLGWLLTPLPQPLPSLSLCTIIVGIANIRKNMARTTK